MREALGAKRWTVPWGAMVVTALSSTPLACDNARETTLVAEKDNPSPRTRPRRSAGAAPPSSQPAASATETTAPSSAPTAPSAAPTALSHPGLRDPRLADLRAPKSFDVRFATTRGLVSFHCERSWSPRGADRFYSLVVIGYFTDVAIYRVIPNFVAQWGIHGDPAVNLAWKDANLPVEPVTHKNERGTLSFAMAASPTTRSTQLFINYGNNAHLDKMGFAPVCAVSHEGMAVVDTFDSRYADTIASRQGEIMARGNPMLRAEFPGLDYIVAASIVLPHDGQEHTDDKE